MAEKSVVYKVDAELTAAGSTFPVNSFSIGWGVNLIPYANIIIPLSELDAFTAELNGSDVVYTGTDFSAANSNFLKALIEAMDSRAAANFTLIVKNLSGGSGASVYLVDWIVSNVKLMPQSRVSPGGIQVTIEHPMCKLKELPGFFVVDTPKFKELLEDVKGGDIVSIGDSVLDAVESAMGDSSYKEKYTVVAWQPGLQIDAIKSARLGDFIDPNGVGLPFVKILSEVDGIEKACVRELASYFVGLKGVTPFEVLIGLGNQLGFYVCTEYNEPKAKLKVADPWKDRKNVRKAPRSKIFQVSITPDTDKICGVRAIGTTTDTIICSTLQGKSALKSDKTSCGDTIFYYQTRGRFLDVSFPKFAANMLGRAAVIAATPSESGKASTSDSSAKLVSADEVEDPVKAIKATSVNETKAREIVNSVKVAWAEANFLRAFRATMQLEVVRPLVDTDFPEIGSFYSCNVGTGGSTVTGLVMSNVIQGSCVGGSAVTVTTRAAYAGDPPDVSIENKVW